jgi:hypothetical protein
VGFYSSFVIGRISVSKPAAHAIAPTDRTAGSVWVPEIVSPAPDLGCLHPD